jgi:predicted porin
MAKYQIDAMLDAALNYLKTNCNAIHVDGTQPTNYTTANATYMLAQKTTSYAITGSPANGDSSGRKITTVAASSVSVTNAGSALHVALTGTVSSVATLLYVTTCATKALGTSDKVNIPAWDIEIADAT